tara:strand:- start:391 stop:642 length:252 start_codon:yes stop_codon:yes gene_type:complete
LVEGKVFGFPYSLYIPHFSEKSTPLFYVNIYDIYNSYIGRGEWWWSGNGKEVRNRKGKGKERGWLNSYIKGGKEVIRKQKKGV